jgi:hypothetical protein
MWYRLSLTKYEGKLPVYIAIFVIIHNIVNRIYYYAL